MRLRMPCCSIAINVRTEAYIGSCTALNISKSPRVLEQILFPVLVPLLAVHLSGRIGDAAINPMTEDYYSCIHIQEPSHQWGELSVPRERESIEELMSEREDAPANTT